MARAGASHNTMPGLEIAQIFIKHTANAATKF
jgi:hypothetical protein